MWLKGMSTQANIVDKLTKLIAGEVADDFGNTVPIGDRWIRRYAGQNFLHSPSSEKVALPTMYGRTGYFQQVGTAAPSGNANAIRLTSIQTVQPTGSPSQWLMFVYIGAANTVAFNYSTAQVVVGVHDARTGALVAGFGVFTPNSSGVVTLSSAYGGGQLTCTNPVTGILSRSNMGSRGDSMIQVRYFNTTYMGGVDFWPMLNREYTGESPSFSVAPPGSAGTDYAVTANYDYLVSSGTFDVNYPAQGRLGGGYGAGLGIKTSTALTGAQYAVSWNCFGQGLCLEYNGTQYIQAHLNGSWENFPQDGLYRRIQGNLRSAWMRMFTGVPLATSAVQYWVSVKADGVFIVLNADPGVGGVLSAAGTWSFTPSDPTNDLFHWVWSGNVIDYTVDSGNYSGLSPHRGWCLLSQQFAANGYGLPNGRDWITGWMRNDIVLQTATFYDGGVSNTDLPYYNSSWDVGWGTSSWSDQFSDVYVLGQSPYMVNMTGSTGSWQTSTGRDFTSIYQYKQAKPHPGYNKWMLYGQMYSDVINRNDTNEYDGVLYRGYINSKVLYIPDFGWSSGDELTDSSTSKIYFLIAPDFVGNGMGRLKGDTNAFGGGIAIEER